MDNPIYNSLAEKLKQNGIIPETDSVKKEENVFLTGLIEDDEPEIVISEPEVIKEETKPQKQVSAKPPIRQPKKRINRYDLDILNGDNTENEYVISPLKILKRFLSFRQMQLEQGTANFKERIFNGLFPKLYKIKIAKDALKRLTELDIDTKALLDKTIPYGESEIRYEELVKYLNYANEIQMKLKRKFY